MSHIVNKQLHDLTMSCADSNALQHTSICPRKIFCWNQQRVLRHQRPLYQTWGRSSKRLNNSEPGLKQMCIGNLIRTGESKGERPTTTNKFYLPAKLDAYRTFKHQTPLWLLMMVCLCFPRLTEVLIRRLNLKIVAHKLKTLFAGKLIKKTESHMHQVASPLKMQRVSR